MKIGRKLTPKEVAILSEILTAIGTTANHGLLRFKQTAVQMNGEEQLLLIVVYPSEYLDAVLSAENADAADEMDVDADYDPKKVN